MRKENLEDLITQAEAARLRGVTFASITQLIARGRLSTVEIAGKKLVRRSEILKFQKMKPTGRPKKTKAAIPAKKSSVAVQRKIRSTEKKGSKKTAKK